MSVIVYAENWEGKFKKATYEAVSFGKAVADKVGEDFITVSIGNVGAEDLNELSKYGASKIIQVSGASDEQINHQYVASVLQQVVSESGNSVVVFSGTWKSKAAAPRLAIKIGAGVVSEAVEVPSNSTPFTVKKKSFSGKAFANVEVTSDNKILILSTNAFGTHENAGAADQQSKDVAPSELDQKLQSVSIEKSSGKINLPEAELVVSAGRGLKGAENWGMVEELADLLGAGTACSKPVADIGWRPHHEHVGQTGIAIAPNLYIAIGISGAIQHLAGVSSSKNIVVINTDPEAPFFKAADYGIVGDAFQVVPKLIEAVKAFKG